MNATRRFHNYGAVRVEVGTHDCGCIYRYLDRVFPSRYDCLRQLEGDYMPCDSHKHEYEARRNQWSGLMDAILSATPGA